LTTVKGIPPALLEKAEDDEPDSQFELATRYRDGRGTTKNLKQAFMWFRKAALNGHPQGMLALSQCHLHHRGTPANPREAYIWALLFQACADSPDAATFAASQELLLPEEDQLAAQDEASVRHQILCERPLKESDLNVSPADLPRKEAPPKQENKPGNPPVEPEAAPAPNPPPEQPAELDDDPEPSPGHAYKYLRNVKKNFDPGLVEFELVVPRKLRTTEDMDFTHIKIRYNKKDSDKKALSDFTREKVNKKQRRLLICLAAQNSVSDPEQRAKNIKRILSVDADPTSVSRLNKMFEEIFPGCKKSDADKMLNRKQGLVNIRLAIDTAMIINARDYACCRL